MTKTQAFDLGLCEIACGQYCRRSKKQEVFNVDKRLISYDIFDILKGNPGRVWRSFRDLTTTINCKELTVMGENTIVQKSEEFKVCLYCGKSYSRPEKCLLGAWLKRKYCSKSCATRASLSGPVLDKYCLYCGARMQKREDQSPSSFNKMKYCSRRCVSLATRNGSFKKGEEHCNWKGGYFYNKLGYKNIKIGDKYVLEHVFLVESFLGRKIEKDECVHHCNKKTSDNNLENLELMLRTEHSRLHNTGVKRTDEYKKHLSEERKNWNQKEEHQQWRKEITEKLIMNALDRYKTQRQTAKHLGISVGTLQNRLKYYSTRKGTHQQCQI